MGEATRVEITTPPPANGLSADAAQKLTEQAHNGVTQVKTGEGESRPTWLPAKFKTPEDAVKAYVELEKKMGAGKPVEEKPTGEGTPKPPAGEPTKGTDGLKLPEKTADQQTAEQVVAKAGLKLEVLNAEYSQKGELSAESMKALADAGITKEMVDVHIEGLEAIRTIRLNDLHGVAGGAEKFEEMHRWSVDNIPDTEKAVLNKAIADNDHGAIKLAFQGIHAKWQAAGQDEPVRRLEGTRTTTESGGYAHRDEILADMKTTKYKTSQAERDRVLAKIRVSAKGVW